MSRRNEYMCLTLVIGVYIALVARATGYDFVWDDVHEIETNPIFDRPLSEGIVLTQTERTDPTLVQLQDVTIAYDSYRPLLFATYWIEIQVFGRGAAPMHVTNLVLGVLAILVAHALARRWLAELGWPYVIVATAIFALHPMQVEPVAYISGRGDLLAGLLALCSTYAALRAGDTRARPRIAWAGVACVTFAASLLAKESYIGLPVALAVMAAPGSSIGGQLRARGWISAVLVVVAIAYFGLRAALVSSTSGGALAAAITGLPGVWLEYLRIAALPFDLSTERLHAGTFTLPGWLALALAIGLAVLVIVRKREVPAAIRVACAGLAWFAMLLAPAAVSIMSTGVAADRYGYAGMLGLGVAIAALVAHAGVKWPRIRRWIRLGLGAWGILLLAVSWMQVPVWRDNVTLYTHAVAMAPDSADAHYRLGYLDARVGNWERAIPLLERATQLDPGNVRALNNLGVGFMQTGRFTDAETVLQRAVDRNPAHFRSWFNLGVTRLRLGRREAGCANIRSALEINPRYGVARAEYDRACVAR